MDGSEKSEVGDERLERVEGLEFNKGELPDCVLDEVRVI